MEIHVLNCDEIVVSKLCQNKFRNLPCLPTISATCSDEGTGTHSVMFWLLLWVLFRSSRDPEAPWPLSRSAAVATWLEDPDMPLIALRFPWWLFSWWWPWWPPPWPWWWEWDEPCCCSRASCNAICSAEFWTESKPFDVEFVLDESIIMRSRLPRLREAGLELG